MSGQVSARLREDTYERAWGRCQCTSTVCRHHAGRCGEGLRGAWRVHPVDPAGPWRLENVIAVCKECDRALVAAAAEQ
jgi:hypothetical protein